MIHVVFAVVKVFEFQMMNKRCKKWSFKQFPVQKTIYSYVAVLFKIWNLVNTIF